MCCKPKGSYSVKWCWKRVRSGYDAYDTRSRHIQNIQIHVGTPLEQRPRSGCCEAQRPTPPSTDGSKIWIPPQQPDPLGNATAIAPKTDRTTRPIVSNEANMTEHRLSPHLRAHHPVRATAHRALANPHLSTYTHPDAEHREIPFCVVSLIPRRCQPPDAAHACSVAEQDTHPIARSLLLRLNGNLTPLVAQELLPAHPPQRRMLCEAACPFGITDGRERGGEPRWSDADPGEMPNGYRDGSLPSCYVLWRLRE